MNNLKILILGFLGAGLFHFLRLNTINDSFAQKNDKFLSIQNINLVDKNGKTRMQLGLMNDGSPGIWLFDSKGIVRLNLGLYADGSAVYGIQDKNGQMIQLTRSFGENEAPLSIYKHNGTDVMIIGLNPTDLTPFIMNYDHARKKNIQFGKYDGP